jgi:hypothetical protein
MTRIVTIGAVTLALGTSVFAAWSLALGRLAATGPGTVLRDQPVLVLGLVAVFAALVGTGVGSLASRSWSRREIAAVLVAAWIGELLVLVVAGFVLGNEITPTVAPQLWAMATGGPLQPAAATAGAWLAWSMRRGRTASSA